MMVYCMFCLQHTARVSLTKKGIPTLFCANCMSRTFLNRPEALDGYKLLFESCYAQLASLGRVDTPSFEKEAIYVRTSKEAHG